MSNARNLADIVTGNFDVPLGALDNVPPSNDASALTTGTLGASRLPAGSVIQFVQTQYNTQVAFSSTTYQSLFSASITPKSTTSKIFVIAAVAFGGKGSFTVFRGSTDLFPGMKAYQVFAPSSQTNWNSSSVRHPLSIYIVDSPNSTSSVTYTVQGRSYSTSGDGSAGINEGNAIFPYQGTSLILMEIA